MKAIQYSIEEKIDILRNGFDAKRSDIIDALQIAKILKNLTLTEIKNLARNIREIGEGKK